MLHKNFYLLKNKIIQLPTTAEQIRDQFFQNISFQKAIKRGSHLGKIISILNQAPNVLNCESSAYHVLEIQ